MIESAGGIAGRETIRQEFKRVFHFTIGPNDVAEVMKVFDTHRQRWPIAVWDPSRSTYEDEVLEQDSDGSDTNFARYPLRYRIAPATGTRYFHKRILVPDEVAGTTVISINGTPLHSSAWTMEDPGIVAFAGGMVGSGDVVTASGAYLVAGAFVDPALTVKVYAIGSDGPVMGIQSVIVREILEEELVALLAQTDDSR